MAGGGLIGALRVVLGMDSAAFEEGADAAEKRARAFSKKMDGIAAGFTSCQRVTSFGLFEDTSDYAPYGCAISLNVLATK